MPQERKAAFAYGLAIGTILAAVALASVAPSLRERGVFMLFVGAVSLTAWYGGWRPAIVCIVCAAIAAVTWALPDPGVRWITEPADILRLMLFVFVSVLISVQHTAQNRAARQLESSERRLKLALEYARMGVWEWNLRTGAFWCSSSLEQLFGCMPGKFSPTYETFMGYVHPDDRDFLQRAVTHVLGDEGMDFEIEHRFLRADQSVCWTVTRGRVFYDAAGRPERIVAVAWDVSNKKTATETAAGGSLLQSPTGA